MALAPVIPVHIRDKRKDGVQVWREFSQWDLNHKVAAVFHPDKEREREGHQGDMLEKSECPPSWPQALKVGSLGLFHDGSST